MIQDYILIMAMVTYLIRMLPMVIFRRKLENKYVKSFLYYVPFAVLGAMTIPDIFTSTSSVYSAIAGTIVAVFLSIKEKGLLICAISACLAVYAVEFLLRII